MTVTTASTVDLGVHADRDVRRDAAHHLHYDPAQHRIVELLDVIAAQIAAIDGGLDAGRPAGHDVSVDVCLALRDIHEGLAELRDAVATRTVYAPTPTPRVRHLCLVGGAG